jgi:hypothetical protein
MWWTTQPVQIGGSVLHAAVVGTGARKSEQTQVMEGTVSTQRFIASRAQVGSQSWPRQLETNTIGKRRMVAHFLAAIFTSMNDVTRILSAIEQGDPHAAESLLPLAYDELRQLAAQKLTQERPGHTLEATALVHEAYLRLVDVKQVQQWNGRGHFFGAAAEAMRRILVDGARRKESLKGVAGSDASA